MNTVARWKNGLSSVFASTLFPSRSRISNLKRAPIHASGGYSNIALLAAALQGVSREALHLRGRAGLGPFLGRGSGRQAGIVPPLAKAIKMARGLDVELAVVSRGRAKTAALQRHVGNNFPVLVVRFDNV